VLRRALELTEPALADPIRVDQVEVLRRVADDLGIPSGALERALAEERAGLLAPLRRTRRRSLVEVLAGPAEIDVERTLSIPGDPLGELDVWLQKAHALRRRSIQSNRGVWERRRDPVAAVRRSVGSLVGEAGLGQLAEIRAEQVDLGDERLVRLRADVHARRAGYVAGGATLGAAGLTGVVVLGVIVAPVAFVAAPVAVVAGGLVAARHRARARETARELERLLDQVASGEAPRGSFGAVARQWSGPRRPGTGKMDTA
jgi:hypothetical protein